MFIACDTTSLSEVKKIIHLSKNKHLNIGYKFGLEFFNSKSGRSFVSNLPKNNTAWLDLKLMDIPNTVASSIYSLKDLKNAEYLTVHASGGYEMMRAAKKAGVDGIVCSGHEVKLIKNICKGMQIITPGIRLEGDSKQDQKRVMTPMQAFNNGATGIVIGRSITRGNIKHNIQKLITSLK